MSVLLSVRPRYAEAILAGQKKYEFRKAWPRQKSGQKVFIYTTAPVRKIVGSFVAGNVIEDHPASLWKRYRSKGGIEEQAFFDYFGSRSIGYAIEISELEVFDVPLEPEDRIPGFVAPQSYMYIENSVDLRLR
ncbi:MAG: hypothetical protein ABSA72_11635 [Nitrososphaerales archaeon]|jgi:type I restriction enzyme S subunit